jgi:NhaP-type Na+/H+ or K+/H+ antiporter
VLGGCAIGFVPGMPRVQLDPDLVLLLFLPFLLYGAAFFSSLRDLRANVRPIGLLAIGLVTVTMVSVAAMAHFAIGSHGRCRSCSARWSRPPTRWRPRRFSASSARRGGS